MEPTPPDLIVSLFAASTLNLFEKWRGRGSPSGSRRSGRRHTFAEKEAEISPKIDAMIAETRAQRKKSEAQTE